MACPSSLKILAMVYAAACILHQSCGASATDVCTDIKNSDGRIFNLEPMERTTGDDFSKPVSIGSAIQFVYRVNICQNTVTPCKNTQGAVTESLVLAAGETCRVLGRVDNMETFVMQFAVTPDNPLGEGIRIKYPGGDICDPVTRLTREAWVEVQCSVAARPVDMSGAIDVKSAGDLIEMQKTDTCKTVFQMKSWYACSDQVTGRGGLSGGSIFMIIVFVTFATYCIAGSVINCKLYGKTGSEMIPHEQFWKALPTHTRNGCAYSSAKVMGLFGGSSDGGNDGGL